MSIATIRLALAAGILAVLMAPPAAAAGTTIHVPADQPTIQAAVDAAQSGDVVEVAAGKYTGPIVIDSKTGVTVRAVGVVTITAKGTEPAVTIGACTNVTFEGFTISKSPSDGIRVNQGSFVSILHCVVTKSKANGIWAATSPDFTVADCTVTKTGKDFEGISVSFGQTAPSPRCRVLRCTVSKTGGEGIDVRGDSALIEDCIVSKTKNDGIELERAGGTDNCIVRRCTVTSAGDVGIVVTGRGNLVENNTVTNSSYHGISIFQDDFGATANTIVRSNTVTKTKKNQGIHLNAPNCTLDANTVSGAHDDGINVDETANTVTNNIVTKAGQIGVHLLGSGHTVTGNSATGSKKGDLWDESTGSTLSGNTFPKIKD